MPINLTQFLFLCYAVQLKADYKIEEEFKAFSKSCIGAEYKEELETYKVTRSSQLKQMYLKEMMETLCYTSETIVWFLKDTCKFSREPGLAVDQYNEGLITLYELTSIAFVVLVK